MLWPTITFTTFPDHAEEREGSKATQPTRTSHRDLRLINSPLENPILVASWRVGEGRSSFAIMIHLPGVGDFLWLFETERANRDPFRLT
jgi:hypothetical protein